MLQLLEGNCAEVEAFCLSAVDIVLLFLREKKEAMLQRRCEKNTVCLTVLLHLSRTLNSMCGLDGVREWQLESVLKLRLVLWLSFKTGLFNPCEKNSEGLGAVEKQLIRESKEEESRLAGDLFSGPATTTYLCRENVLSWFVMDILLPYCFCWKKVDMWKNSSDHPFFLWVLTTLKNANNTPEFMGATTSLKQQAVEMAVLLCADTALVAADSKLFTDAYFNTLLSLTDVSSFKLFVELTSSIQNGVIRGDRLYGNDPNVLLEALYQAVSLDTKSVHKKDELQITLDIFLKTLAAP